MRKESVVVVGSLIIALSFIAFLQPPFSVTGRVVDDILVEDVTCKIVSTPYEEYQTITSQETYEENVVSERALTYELLSQKVYSQVEGIYSEDTVHGFINISNNDVVGGDFKIIISFSSRGVVRDSHSLTRFLSPGEYFSMNKGFFDVRYGDVSVSFEVIPEVKSIISKNVVTKPVERVVAVQKFRDVEVCD